MTTFTARGADCRERALRILGDLPPFSPVLNRLMATLGDEDVAYSKVADIVEKDTVIAGNILKLVNSALYGRRGTVNSVRHAVSLLGLNKLRNAVFSMSLARMWNRVRTPPGWSMARFNLHSVAVAIVADLLAQRGSVGYPEGAFVAGLFHDLGKLLIAMGLSEEYAAVRRRFDNGEDWLAAEQAELGMNHAEISAIALELWNLPDPVRIAVRYHHDPAGDLTDVRHGMGRLSLALYCADVYVNAAGIGTTEVEVEPTVDVDHPFAPLGLEDEGPALIEEFQREFEAITPFFR